MNVHSSEDYRVCLEQDGALEDEISIDSLFVCLASARNYRRGFAAPLAQHT